jgi:hypothetical protein
MNENSDDRAYCVEYLSRYLLDTLERERLHIQERAQCADKTNFLAHQIVCDLEEIYVEPFGAVSANSIVIGYGAREGLKMCNRMLSSTDFATGRSMSNMDMIKEMTELIQSHIKKPTASQCRTMLGCYVDINGVVRVLLNGRPLGVQDVEHYMCKLYIGVSKTMSSRGSSANPQPCKPGLHQVYFKDDTYPWDDENIRLILLDVVETFLACSENGKVGAVPRIFLLAGEEAP